MSAFKGNEKKKKKTSRITSPLAPPKEVPRVKCIVFNSVNERGEGGREGRPAWVCLYSPSTLGIMAFLLSHLSRGETGAVHGDNGAIRSLGEQWVRKNYTFISSAKSGGERERERGPSRCHGVDQGLYLLYSQYAPRPREIHGWANLPANHGKPVEKESSRAKSWRSPLSLFATLETLEFVSTESKFDRFHFVEMLVENPPTCGSESCVFILLFFNFKLSRDTIRYDTIRYEFRFIPLSCLERKLAPARLGFSN